MNYKNKIPLSSDRFRVPDGYLNNFRMNSIENIKLKREGFLIPESYFNSLDLDLIQRKISLNKIKFLKNFFVRTSSVAAIFVLVFLGYNQFKVDNQIKYDDIINYVDNDIIELSTYDFIDLIEGNDLDFSEYINYSDIENYFIENTNAEIYIYE